MFFLKRYNVKEIKKEKRKENRSVKYKPLKEKKKTLCHSKND